MIRVKNLFVYPIKSCGGVQVDVEFRFVKPCSRCVVTTVDQATGERKREPLRTLSTYRTMDGQVLFGKNLVHRGRGTVRVGDPVEVLDSVRNA